MNIRLLGVAVATMISAALSAGGDETNRLPHKVQGLTLVDRAGAAISGSLSFRDETGATVTAEDWKKTGVPTLLVIAYYRCPMLCGIVQKALGEGLAPLRGKAGKDYQIVTVSMDPKEGPAEATAARNKAASSWADTEVLSHWRFLTSADVHAVRQLADQVGFPYRYDAETDQYLHPAAVFVLSPELKLVRVLTGALFKATDLTLALAEAKEGRQVSLGEHLLLFCYQYDAAKEGYSLQAVRLMRVAGLFTVFALIAMILILRRRENKA